MADFYDPTSDVQTGWSSTGAAHYTEIDEGIRNPSQPTLTDYVSTNSNNAVDEWGFPAVTGSPPKIVAWLYAETQVRSTIVVSLQQGGAERATITIPISSPKKWYQCVWDAPSGDLSTLTIEVTQVKSGAAPTYAYVYAAYLRAGPNLDKQVAAGGDDGYYYGTTGWSSWQGGLLYLLLGYWTNYWYYIWARFTTVDVPPGATIDVAYTSYLWYAQDGSDPTKAILKGIEEPNTTQIVSAADYEGRDKTEATVPWQFNYAAGWMNSADISPVAQEIIDQPGWVANNAMAICCEENMATHSSGRLYARSYEYNDNTYGPKLHIEFTPAGPEGQPTHLRTVGIPTGSGFRQGGSRWN